MDKFFCSNCGAQIDKTASFCFNCGNKINLSDSTPPNMNMAQTSRIKARNPFTKFIFILLAVQIISIIISSIPGAIGGLAFALATILIIPILIISILCVVKSKKYNGKGKVIGIIFTVLTALLIGAVAIALVVSGGTGNNANNIEDNYISNCVDTVTIDAIEDLKDSLKDPSSLKINKIYVKVYDTRITARFSDGTYYEGGEFKGYFEIYIDYTAKNGFGGVNREYQYFKYNDYFTQIDSEEIDSMPAVTDDFWVLDVSKYN